MYDRTSVKENTGLTAVETVEEYNEGTEEDQQSRRVRL